LCTIVTHIREPIAIRILLESRTKIPRSRILCVGDISTRIASIWDRITIRIEILVYRENSTGSWQLVGATAAEMTFDIKESRVKKSDSLLRRY
jgi:hypothetical protein